MRSATTILYLVNRYPHVTHTFIRREIHALESLGLKVVRVSIRESDAALSDPDDRRERSRTSVLFDEPAHLWLSAFVRTFLRNPRRMMRAFRYAFHTGPRSRALAYVAEACLVARMVRRTGATRVHAHFGTNSALVAALARELTGIPFSFTVHGPEEFIRAEALGLSQKIRRADNVVAISEHGHRELTRICDPADRGKLVVVRCGLEESRFVEVGDAELPAPATFVCIARLVAEKGIDTLIAALARLPEFRLELVGDGPRRAEIEAALGRARLGGRVVVRGWCTGHEISRSLQRARYLVCPSFAEGLPVVLMEAMAAFRPVLASRIAGIPELVVPGENGWLVTPGDVDDWTRALRESIATSDAEWARLGRGAFAAVSMRHRALSEATRLAARWGAT